MSRSSKQKTAVKRFEVLTADNTEKPMYSDSLPPSQEGFFRAPIGCVS